MIGKENLLKFNRDIRCPQVRYLVAKIYLEKIRFGADSYLLKPKFKDDATYRFSILYPSARSRNIIDIEKSDDRIPRRE